MTIASRPPSEEEEEGDADVLDADHLVIGVELEVVLPAVGAVAGVVVGDRRLAGRPAEPVVEGAEADQPAERGRDRGDDDVRVAGLLGLEDLEAADRAQADDEAEAEEPADARRRASRGSSPVCLIAAGTFDYLLLKLLVGEAARPVAAGGAGR